MKDFIKYFTGLKRNFGFCNINNGYKDPDTGKLKFNPGDYGWSGKLITEEDYKLLLDNFENIEVWKEKFPPESYIFKGLRNNQTKNKKK